MADFETKCFGAKEIKASGDKNDGKMRFEGYLAYFNNVDLVGDIVEKGAFLNTLSQAKSEGRVIPVLKQHGTRGSLAGDDTPIGYFEDAYEDEKGLYVKGVLFSTDDGKNMHTLLKEAPVGTMGMSIGYGIANKRCAREEERQKGAERVLTELDLREGSIVTFPANTKARVEDVKADALHWRSLEKHLNKNGFSAAESKRAVSLIKSFDGKEDTEEPKEDATSAAKILAESVKAAAREMEKQEALRGLKNFVDSLK
jgi:uncharacterized protein